MERQLKLADEFLERIRTSYSKEYLKQYISKNIKAKETLNQLLGLTPENDYTVTLPVLLDNTAIVEHHPFLNSVLTSVFHNSDYKDLDYVKGTIVNPKGQTIKITRVIPKFQEAIIKHGNYNRACRELGITDSSFASIGPRLGELAHATNQELFITSSLAEFMMVNDNSSYTSCYRHGVFTSSSYWTGTLSYGMDKFTLLVGIRNKTTKYKTGRSWLWVFPDGIDSAGTDMETPFMVQPKSYGEFTSLHRKAVRMYIQSKILSNVTWKAGKKSSIHYSTGYGYIDNYDLTVSWMKGEDKPDPFIKFEHDLICLNCGSNDTLNSGDGLCDYCSEEGTEVCSNCGDRVHEDDAYWGRDYCYCGACFNDLFFYCEECGEDEYRDEAVPIRGRNNIETLVCIHCAHNSSYINYCEECETYYYNRYIASAESVEGDVICADCVTGYCEDCGNAFSSNSEQVEIGVYTYCRHCAENHEADEEECEEAA